MSARFLRLSSWSLGGLSISQPVMMVMELGGLVRGAPGEVVGIVGYDLFRRAVVQLPQLLPASHGAAGWHQGEALEASGGQGCGSGSEGEEGYSGSGGESPVGSWDGDGEEIGGEEAGQTRGRDGAWGVWGRQGSVASGPQPPQPRPQSTPAFGEEDGLGTGKGGSGSGSGSDAEVAPAKAQSVAVAAAASAHSSMDGPNSTSSSSSGGGSARQEAAAPEGGRRRSAGRSATARLWRRAAQRVPYTRLEAVLHHPLEFRGEAEWEWHPLIMVRGRSGGWDGREGRRVEGKCGRRLQGWRQGLCRSAAWCCTVGSRGCYLDIAVSAELVRGTPAKRMELSVLFTLPTL